MLHNFKECGHRPKVSAVKYCNYRDNKTGSYTWSRRVDKYIIEKVKLEPREIIESQR